MSDLYNTVGVATYKNILADPVGADLISVAVAPGEGEVPAGRVIVRDDATGLYKQAAAADITTSALIAVTKSAVSAVAGAIAPETGAYRAGKLVKANVTLKGDAAVTRAIASQLSVHGIVFDIADNTTDTVENA